ncbi:pstD domain protein [Mycobacterium xenopi 3993]|nr:pstD domain protein [Mycobacterium xenopi 3993]
MLGPALLDGKRQIHARGTRIHRHRAGLHLPQTQLRMLFCQANITCTSG